MKISKDTPAFARYFTARIKPFTKPLFLGSFGGLLIAGLAIYQYWRHPDWLQTNSNSTQPITDSQNSLPNASQEDLSVAADIDNVDLLLKELQQNRVSNEANTSNQIRVQKQDTKYSRFQKSQEENLQKSSRLFPETTSDSSDINTGNQKIMELLQPSSLSDYQSPNAPVKKFKTSKLKVIPNPIGSVYLSNRQQKFKPNSLKPPATSSAKKNQNINVAPELGATNESTYPASSTQENNITNTFIPASSAIQSQQTLPASVSNSAISSPKPGFNVTNPYLGTGFNSGNSYSGEITNNATQNSINTNSINNIPNSTTESTPISRNSFTNNNNSAPNSLQNNYRSNQLVRPNYNRSAPSNYQSQPQGYTQNNFLRRNNESSSTPTIRNVDINSNNNNLNQQNSNALRDNSFNTPSLQPSGVLTTGTTRR